MSRWLDCSGPWFVGQFNLCWVCLWGEVLVLFSACGARRRGEFVRLYCLRGLLLGLTHLPVGVAFGTSLYWFCL